MYVTGFAYVGTSLVAGVLLLHQSFTSRTKELKQSLDEELRRDKALRRSLEEAIENFAGSAVIISHDRWFLDRLATHILAFEGDSKVVFFDGNYTEYEQYRKEVLGLKELLPHRIKYRKMTR